MKTQKTTLRALALVFAVSVLAQPAAQAGMWQDFIAKFKKPAVSSVVAPEVKPGLVDNMTSYWNSLVEITKNAAVKSKDFVAEKGSSLMETIKENPKTAAAIVATLAASGMAYYFLKGGKKVEEPAVKPGTESKTPNFGVNAQGVVLVEKSDITGNTFTQAQVDNATRLKNLRAKSSQFNS